VLTRWRTTLLVLVVALIAIVSPTDVHVQTASVNRLLLTLQQQDVTGVPILNRRIGFISWAGSVGVFSNNKLTTFPAPVSIPLPTATVLQFYFRNTSPSASITVTWTPTGGASVVTQTLLPGGVVAFWQSATGTVGITALSLSANLLPATYEMFLGG
jgi:hypothetical protein